MRLASFSGIYWLISKFLITPPKVVANGEMSKESIGLMPLLPLIIPSQVSETVLAKGVTAPNPVITTRRLLNVVYRKNIKEGNKGLVVQVSEVQDNSTIKVMLDRQTITEVNSLPPPSLGSCLLHNPHRCGIRRCCKSKHYPCSRPHPITTIACIILMNMVNADIAGATAHAAISLRPYIIHMVMVSADIAGANICPCSRPLTYKFIN